jgi:hypothetical protein
MIQELGHLSQKCIKSWAKARIKGKQPTELSSAAHIASWQAIGTFIDDILALSHNIEDGIIVANRS